MRQHKHATKGKKLDIGENIMYESAYIMFKTIWN